MLIPNDPLSHHSIGLNQVNQCVLNLSNNQPIHLHSLTNATLQISTAKLIREPTMRKSASSFTRTTHDVTNVCSTQTQHYRNNKQCLQSSISSKTNAEFDDLKHIQALLEQSMEEKKALSEKMDTKEAAWERLLTAKESYALRVQEKDSEILQLNNALKQAQVAIEQSDNMTKERDTLLLKLSLSSETEKQLNKTIERLGAHIQSLQQQNLDQTCNHETVLHNHVAQVEQLRKQLVERDQTVIYIERECADQRQINAEVISAYENKIAQLSRDNELAMKEREAHIDKLQQAVNHFHQANASVMLEAEGRMEENEPIETDSQSPQKRLEYQLELTTYELECEREQVKLMALDIEQLKEEIKRLHRLSATIDSEFYALRSQLEGEIIDKRRIMEEANVTIENQAKAEEENENLRLSLLKSQFELAEALRKTAVDEKQRTKTEEVHYLIEKKKTLEQENQLISDRLTKALDKCLLLETKLSFYEQDAMKQQGNTGEHVQQESINMLKLKMAHEARRYHDLKCSKQLKTDALRREVKELEMLIENKVFKESELEDLIEEKEMSINILKIRLQAEEEKNFKQPFNSLKSHAHSILPPSPTSPQHLFMDQHPSHSHSRGSSSSRVGHVEDVYCEICEAYGHEVITCKSVSIYNTLEKEDSFALESHLSTPSSSYYCVNCDIFGEHSSEDCPNQDETF
ncbi:hypothetical protein BD560DRAFT_411683 [Blakeslea trispora]|nr:hypothetical protein BD560DRAFT_411683 [Blakeslea trispora]